jgi:hypothetical protein
MTTESERLRERAARCLRLASGGIQNDMNHQLWDLAADYLERAQAVERAAEKQQQAQPKKAGDLD